MEKAAEWLFKCYITGRINDTCGLARPCLIYSQNLTVISATT